MTIGQVDITDRYERHRIREPSDFIKGSIRTHDIGRKGLSKRLAGRLKRNGAWATQSLLIDRTEPLERKKQLRKSAKRMITRGY